MAPVYILSNLLARSRSATAFPNALSAVLALAVVASSWFFYVFPGVDGPMATILAGLLGIAVVFALVWLAGRALARRRS